MADKSSSKRALIDKANSTVVIVVSVAAALTAFCGVATKALYNQATYQNRVISAKEEARDQLKADIEAVDNLKKSYVAFTSTTQNIIGGNPQGTGQQDGDNAKIILDALPSFYDFPALPSSLEVLFAGVGSSTNLQVTAVNGVDDEVAQSDNVLSANPEPIAMPFSIALAGDYNAMQGAINAFERSIRPMHINTFDLDGSSGEMTLRIDAETYYQPGKSLKIQTEVVE